MEKEFLEKIVTIRIATKEKQKLQNESEITGLSLSSLIRKKALGHPIKSKVDLILINELRRQGGLLKNNFNTIRELKNVDTKVILNLQKTALNDMIKLIEKVSKNYENQR